MKKIYLVFVLGLWVSTALAQSHPSPRFAAKDLGKPSAANLENGTNLPLSGISGFGSGVAAALGNAINAIGGFLGVIEPQYRKTASYTVGAGENDCAARIVTGGNSLYTLTFNAATDYATGCKVAITNTDAGAGKTLSITGLTYGGFGDNGCGWGNLCPGQTAVYVDIGASSWALVQNPGRWRPQATVTLYVSPSGSDTNDCLSIGTPCTLSGTCLIHSESIDTNGNFGVIIQLEDGIYTGSNGTALCSITGNYGGANLLRYIYGNSTTPANTIINVPANGIGLFTKDDGEVEEQYLTWEGGDGSTFVVGGQDSVVDVFAGNSFGAAGSNSAGFNFSQGSHLNFAYPFTLSGTQTYVFHIGSNADLSSNAVTASIPTAIAPAYFILNAGGFVSWNVTLTGAGVSRSTGVRYSANASGPPVSGVGGCLYLNDISQSAGLAGNVSAVFPVGSCTDFAVGTTWANLLSAGAACGSNTLGVEYAITDATTNTWGATVSAGGGSYSIVAYCDGTNYTVAAK